MRKRVLFFLEEVLKKKKNKVASSDLRRKMMTLPGKRDVMYLDEATLKSIEHLMFQLTIGVDSFRKANFILN